MSDVQERKYNSYKELLKFIEGKFDNFENGNVVAMNVAYDKTEDKYVLHFIESD